MNDRSSGVPPSDPPVPGKRRRRIVAIVIVAVTLLLFGACMWRVGPFLGLGWTWWSMRGERTIEPVCAQNLERLANALDLYLQAEDAYPPADIWMDSLLLYLRADDLPEEEREKILSCPSVEHGHGYAYNAEVAGLWSDEVDDPASTPIIYDSSKPERNAIDQEPLTTLPTPPRHGGNNVLYGDGRVAQVD